LKPQKDEDNNWSYPSELTTDVKTFQGLVHREPERWLQFIHSVQLNGLSLQDKVEILHKDNSQLQVELGDVHAQLLEATERIRTLETDNRVLHVLSRQALSGTDGEKKERSQKIPDPDKFSGERKHYRSWRSDVRLKLLGDGDLFRDEDSKVIYVISLVSGDAKNHIIPYVRPGGVLFSDVDSIFGVLDAAYEDPDVKDAALRKLRKLKQGNRPFSEYRAEFERLVAEIDDNPLQPVYTNLKKDMIEGGISTELKTILTTVEREEDYKKFADQLQIYDTRISTLKDDHRSWIHNAQPRSNPFPRGGNANTAPPHSRPALGGEPMDLSAAKVQFQRTPGPHGKLTDEEKRRRRELGLCGYCGDSTHFVSPDPRRGTPGCQKLANARARLGLNQMSAEFTYTTASTLIQPDTSSATPDTEN
jgi:hypothetical protein